MPTIRQPLLLGGLLVAALLVAPAPVSAAPTVGPEVDVSTGTVRGFTPVSLAVTPAGAVTAAWQALVPGAGDSLDDAVVVASRAAGAPAFGAEQVLSTDEAFAPLLAAQPDGAVTAVWEVGPTARLVGSTKAAADAVFPAHAPLTPDGVQMIDKALSVGQDGTLVLAWALDHGPDEHTVHVRTRAVGAAGWTAPVEIATIAEQVNDVQVGIDAAGEITVVWVADAADGEAETVHAVTRYPDATATDPQLIGTADDISQLRTVSGRARTVAAWVGTFVGADDVDVFRVEVRDRSTGAGFGLPVQVTDDLSDRPQLSLSIDPYDRALLGRALGPALSVASIDSADIVTAEEIPVTGDVGDVRLAVAGDGAVTVFWPMVDPVRPHLYAAHRPAGGDFGLPHLVSGDPSEVETLSFAVGVDSDGDVTAVYDKTPAADPPTIHARVLDVAGPRLESLVVPATTKEGVAVPMSVVAADRWSPPVTVAWSFGDGSTGTGPSPSHRYARIGTYRVTVTATDAVGNVTSQTRSVQVTDGTSPSLVDAELTPRRLPTGEGARLRLSASESARLVGVVHRRRDGHWTQVGTKRWGIQQGVNVERFYGRAAQQRLRSGRYRVVLTATDGAGNSGLPVTLRFRVDRNG